MKKFEDPIENALKKLSALGEPQKAWTGREKLNVFFGIWIGAAGIVALVKLLSAG